jgi:hypothetical protein
VVLVLRLDLLLHMSPMFLESLLSESSILSGLRGDPTHIRVSPSYLAKTPGSCSAARAVKARPALVPDIDFPRGSNRGEDFALGPVQEGIDLIEFSPHDQGRNRGYLTTQAERHTGLARFTVHAVASYRPHTRTLQDRHLRPVRGHWVLNKHGENESGGTLWEAFHWGRLYESPDGTVREFRFLRMGKADGARRSKAETALAALVTAYGSLAPKPRGRGWREPFHVTRPNASVARVRIAEIGLLDGSRDDLFDGTPEEAHTLYQRHAKERVREVVNTITPTPGADCASCKRLHVCTDLRRTTGVLHVPPFEGRPRHVSASALRYISRCPAQAHLRDLRLPKEHEYTPANRRGHAVHAWLETRHAAVDSSPCTIENIPEDWWKQTGHDLDEEQARLGRHMIGHHTQICPLLADVTHAEPEPPLAFLDTEANTVIQAKPDLLYSVDGVLIWRETKTLHSARLRHDKLFRSFPQLALAVVLLAEKALNNTPEDSLVELEVLTSDGCDVFSLDPGDSAEVERAREVLDDLAMAWHREQAFPTRPGIACATCPVARWCPDQMKDIA